MLWARNSGSLADAGNKTSSLWLRDKRKRRCHNKRHQEGQKDSSVHLILLLHPILFQTAIFFQLLYRTLFDPLSSDWIQKGTSLTKKILLLSQHKNLIVVYFYFSRDDVKRDNNNKYVVIKNNNTSFWDVMEELQCFWSHVHDFNNNLYNTIRSVLAYSPFLGRNVFTIHTIHIHSIRWKFRAFISKIIYRRSFLVAQTIRSIKTAHSNVHTCRQSLSCCQNNAF